MSIIEVKNISKVYKIFDSKKKDTTLVGKIGKFIKERSDIANKKKEIFWALKNINFNVEKGDVLGVIGSNGAGKSTLLKIVSGITSPTNGYVRIKGTSTSLLEVGAGFHPELSGRENIYLNAAILGITKKDIDEEFANIVEFSGVGRFLDTPVKFYSSGMYVRLAFAIAAHVKTDIMLIDEVLAVGDYNFQQKCINKINNITNTKERTIIFVSHNIEAIKRICNKTILLKNGEINEQGNTEEIVARYLNSEVFFNKNLNFDFNNAPGNQFFKLKRLEARFTTKHPTVRDSVEIICEFWSLEDNKKTNLSLMFYRENQCIFNSISPVINLKKNKYRYSCLVPGNFLNDGEYSIKLLFSKNFSISYACEETCDFRIGDSRDIDWNGKWLGVVRPKLSWSIN